MGTMVDTRVLVIQKYSGPDESVKWAGSDQTGHKKGTAPFWKLCSHHVRI